jgi:hypothetical protein
MDRPWGIRISAFGITGRTVRNRALHSRFGNGFKGQNYPPVGTIGRGTGCFDRIGGESAGRPDLYMERTGPLRNIRRLIH